MRVAIGRGKQLAASLRRDIGGESPHLRPSMDVGHCSEPDCVFEPDCTADLLPNKLRKMPDEMRTLEMGCIVDVLDWHRCVVDFESDVQQDCRIAKHLTISLCLAVPLSLRRRNRPSGFNAAQHGFGLRAEIEVNVADRPYLRYANDAG